VGEPLLVTAELAARKAICACAVLTSAVTASDAAVKSNFCVAFTAC
jgi:hypothetical protein